jgi:hypothetical protein
MSLGGAMLAMSTIPVFFDCMVFQIMPLKDPVYGMRMSAADGDFAFEPRMAEMVGVPKAKGSWVVDRWELLAPNGEGDFQAFFGPSEKDEKRFGLDWRNMRAGGEQPDLSSGIADCKLVQPQAEGRTK